MGNNPSSKLSKLSKSSKSKRISNHEAFFIAHHRVQQSEQQQPQTPIDLKKRVIFVSLMGLYHSWRTCPSPILYSSIFILPIKKQWIYEPDKYSYQHDFDRVLNDTDFVKLLKWKHEQGLVFWMKDAIPLNELNKLNQGATPTPDFVDNADIIFPDDDDTDSSIAPFWRYLSYKISSLYDPVTGKNYNPLLLDLNKYRSSEPRFDQIRKELYFLTMKFKTMSEIIYKSNQTLIVVTTYSLNENSINSEIPEFSQKSHSYSPLPDHKLADIDINDDKIKEIQLIGDITPNPDSSNTKSSPYKICIHPVVDNVADNDNNDDIDNVNDENKNVWWVSTEYGEDVSNHDNDALCDQDDDEMDEREIN